MNKHRLRPKIITLQKLSAEHKSSVRGCWSKFKYRDGQILCIRLKYRTGYCKHESGLCATICWDSALVLVICLNQFNPLQISNLRGSKLPSCWTLYIYIYIITLNYFHPFLYFFFSPSPRRYSTSRTLRYNNITKYNFIYLSKYLPTPTHTQRTHTQNTHTKHAHRTHTHTRRINTHTDTQNTHLPKFPLRVVIKK